MRLKLLLNFSKKAGRSRKCVSIRMKDIVKKAVFFLAERLPLPSNTGSPIRPSEIREILVCPGGGGVGDLLLAYPAVRALKSNFPKASITLFVSTLNSEALSLFPDRDIISDLVFYYVKRGRNAFFHKMSLIWRLRQKHFGLSVFLSRGESMRDETFICSLIGAPHRLGFSRDRVGLHNTVKLEFRDDVPIVQQTLSLLKAAQLDTDCGTVRLKVPEEDMETAGSLIQEHHICGAGPFIVVHMGASWSAEHKCWPLESYSFLIRAIVRRFDAKVVLIGSKGETESGKKVFSEIGGLSVINTIGKTTIAQMAALIDLSDIFIGNDSGPLHLALALGTPSVAIFGPTSPQQIISSPELCISLTSKVPCAPCYQHQAGFKPQCSDAICLKQIKVEEVLEAVERWMKIKKEEALR